MNMVDAGRCIIPAGCRPSATQSSHYAPLMAGRSARRDACQSKNLYCLPTAGFPHCSLFTLSLFLGGKWAEGPMVCSPGQSDRRERRPGCMPIYLAAATRQWVRLGSSSYHVPPPTYGGTPFGRSALGVCPSIWPPQRGIGVSGHRPNSRPNPQVIHLGTARHPTMWGPRTYGGAPFGRSAAGYTT